MKIYSAKKSDINGCLTLLKQTKETHFNRKKLNLAIDNKNTILLVAKEDDKVVGYVIGYISPCNYYDAILQETRVAIAHRRQGIATKLIGGFLDVCKKQKVKCVGAVIGNDDVNGVNLYLKNGFSKEDDWGWYEAKNK